MSHGASRSSFYFAIFVYLAAALLQIPSVASAAEDDPYVAFNVHSGIFHHPDCNSALACTRNCVRIRRSEALARGGRPCKHCGGGLRLKKSEGLKSLSPTFPTTAAEPGAVDDSKIVPPVQSTSLLTGSELVGAVSPKLARGKGQ